MLGSDDQPFRKAAKNHPGVFFADAVAKCRQGVHQVNHELQTSRDGPVFRSWFDNCFQRRFGAKVGPHREELDLLLIVLDEMVAGRFIEAADVLASRMRMLSVGISTGCWESASEFLIYRGRETGLVSPDILDVAHSAAEKRQKRSLRASKVNRVADR